MRLACPNCGALYEVADAAVPVSGREVKCSACEHRWFQRPATSDPATADQAAVEKATRTAAPEPAPDRAADSPPPDGVAEFRRARPTDPAVLQILREEAEREMEQRRRAVKREQPREPAPTRTEAATEAPAPRRALLPDIDEVSPTLHPAGTQDGAVTVIHRAPQAHVRNGFTAGFALSLTLSALAAALYFWSTELSAAIPPLADPLAGYVAAVDTLRLAIHSTAR